MTKKHFIQLAKMVKNARAEAFGDPIAENIVNHLENAVVNLCRENNTNFDEDRFRDACKL